MQNTNFLWHFPFSAERGVFSFEEKRMFQDGESAPQTSDAPKPVAAAQTEAPKLQNGINRDQAQSTKDALADLRGKINTDEKFVDLANDNDQNTQDRKISQEDINKFKSEFKTLSDSLKLLFPNTQVPQNFESAIQKLKDKTTQAKEVSAQLTAIREFLDKYEKPLTEFLAKPENPAGVLELSSTAFERGTKGEVIKVKTKELSDALAAAKISPENTKLIVDEFTNKERPVNSDADIQALRDITKIISNPAEAQTKYPWLPKQIDATTIHEIRNALQIKTGRDIQNDAIASNEKKIDEAIKDPNNFLLGAMVLFLGEDGAKKLLTGGFGKLLQEWCGITGLDKTNVNKGKEALDNVFKKDKALADKFQGFYKKTTQETLASFPSSKQLLPSNLPTIYKENPQNIDPSKKPTAYLLQDILGRFGSELNKDNALTQFKEATDTENGSIVITCKSPTEASAIAEFYAPTGPNTSPSMISSLMGNKEALFGKDPKKTAKQNTPAQNGDKLKQGLNFVKGMQGKDPLAESKENLPSEVKATVQDEKVILSWSPIDFMDKATEIIGNKTKPQKKDTPEKK